MVVPVSAVDAKPMRSMPRRSIESIAIANSFMLDWNKQPAGCAASSMAKRPVKKNRQPDYQQVSRTVLDTVAPDAEPKAIKPAKSPLQPKGKQDAEDIDRAAGEKRPRLDTPTVVPLSGP